MTNKVNATSKNIFTVDFINKKIWGTKKSISEASKGNGAAYKELTRHLKNHPTFEVDVKEQKSHINRAKVSYSGLNYDFMEDYIETKDNRDELKAKYKEVKSFAKSTKKSVYPFTKSWFIEQFGTENDEGKVDALGKTIKQFDMVIAKAEIEAYQQSLVA